MGTVYLAQDVVLERRVAIKFLNPKILDRSGGKERFLIEARAAARVHHPHVAAIYRASEIHDHPYLVSEYVPGRSLDQLELPLPWPDIIRLGLTFAEVLEVAHDRGVLHRDIKPANAILREDGQLKIIDFGIAKILEHADVSLSEDAGSTMSSGRLTEDGRVMGTPHYLAPELWRGQSATVQTDIYALGILLFELATGRVPRAELNGTELAQDAMLREPPPVEELVETNSVEASRAAEVIQQCLCLHPGQRPERARQIADALRASLAETDSDAVDQSESPTPIINTATKEETTLETAKPWSGLEGHPFPTTDADPTGPAPKSISRINKHWPRLLGIICLLALPLVVRPVKRADPSTGALQVKNVERATAFAGCEASPAFDPLTGGLLYEGTYAAGFAVFLHPRDGNSPRRISPGVGWEGAPAPSPSGEQIAFLRRHEGEPATFVMDRGESPLVDRIASGRTRPAWSADGRHLWAGQENSPTRYDMELRQPGLQLSTPPGMIVLHIHERADQSIWALAQTEDASSGAHGLLAYAPGARQGTWRWQGTAVEMLAVFPNGDALVAERSESGAPQLLRIPFDPKKPTVLLAAGPVLPRGGATFSSHGHRIAWSDCTIEENLVWFERNGTGFRESESHRTGWFENEPFAVPNGDTVILTSNRSGKTQLWEVDPDNRINARIIETPGLVPNAASVSRSGRLVAFSVAGKGIFVVEKDAPVLLRQVTYGPSDDYPVFFDDDRSLLFHTEQPGKPSRVGRVAIEGGPVELLWNETSGEPAVSPDGRSVAFVLETDPERKLGIPVIYDGTHEPRPVSTALRPGWYHNLRFSEDGERLLLLEEGRSLLEVAVRSGDILHHYRTKTAQLHGLTYFQNRVLVARIRWSGDLWLAELTERSPRTIY